MMISSAMVLFSTTDRTPVYINLGAMLCLAIAVTMMNFKKNGTDQKSRH